MSKKINLGLYVNAKRTFSGGGALNQYAVKNIEQLLRLRSKTPLDDLNIVFRVSRDALVHKRQISGGMDTTSANHWIGTREFTPALINGNEISGAVGYRIHDPHSRLLTSIALSDFIRRVKNADASAENVLVLWGHADGPSALLMSLANAWEVEGRKPNRAEYIRDTISPAEVEDALKDNDCDKHKLKLVCFDACQCACIEFASVLTPYAKYLIASQTYVPGSGWNYQSWPLHLNNIANDDWRGATVNIAQDFATSQTVNTSISVIDLEKVSAVLNALKTVTEAFDADENSHKKLLEIRKNIKTPDDNNGGLVDMVTLFTIVSETFKGYPIGSLADSLVNAVKDAVVTNNVSADWAKDVTLNGCSIYFPVDKGENKRYMYDIRQDVYFEDDRQLKAFKTTGWHRLVEKMLNS